jgi:uncharacterized protein YfaS (alpha-2-macroglobulin family)
MMGRRAYGVTTATAQMQVVGKRHYGLKALPLGGGGGRSATRELFDTLLLWQGRVQLDARGRGTVEVPLNDSLTSFRIVAVAQSGLHRYGTGGTTIRSTQDVMVLPSLAPVVREGDRYRAEFTARNTTNAAIGLTVGGNVEGLPAPLAPRTVTLAPGGAEVIGWDITAPVGVDRLVYTITATSKGGRADEVRAVQQVRPAVPVRTLQATLVQLEPSGLHSRSRVLPMRFRSAARCASRSPRASPQALDGVREAMRRYPYRCLEQRVSRAIALHDASPSGARSSPPSPPMPTRTVS